MKKLKEKTFPNSFERATVQVACRCTDIHIKSGLPDEITAVLEINKEQSLKDFVRSISNEYADIYLEVIIAQLEEMGYKVEKLDSENVTPIEQPSTELDSKSRFEELFANNKDDKDNSTTVWLSKANKKKLDTLKFKSEGKYQLRPTVNAIIELFFESHKQ